MNTTPRRTNRLLNNPSETKVGVIVQMAAPEVIELCGRASYDFAWIDIEHGAFDVRALADMCRAADAAGISVMPRLPEMDASLVMRSLDAGAMGVVIPNVANAETMEKAVAASLYKHGANGGMRGACPATRASWHHEADWPSFVRWSNENVSVWALIESAQGVEHIDEILCVAGLGGVALGPFDLAHDLGYPGELKHSDVVRAQETVVARAIEKGVPVMATLFAHGTEELIAERRFWHGKGVRVFNVGIDKSILARGLFDRAHAVLENV